MIKWIKCSEGIPINTDHLITDGIDVLVGFFDSYHVWRFSNQDICEDQDFFVTHYMEFPRPPND